MYILIKGILDGWQSLTRKIFETTTSTTVVYHSIIFDVKPSVIFVKFFVLLQFIENTTEKKKKNLLSQHSSGFSIYFSVGRIKFHDRPY